jgi:BASS family bile acid:Na+ symporter
MTSETDHGEVDHQAWADKASGQSDGTLHWDQLREEISVPGKAPATVGQDDGGTVNWARAYGRYLVVGGLICGLAFPDLASMARPFLVPLLVVSLMLALVQADFAQVIITKQRSAMIACLAVTLLVFTPLFVALETKVVLVPYGLPDSLANGMILAALAPPLLSAPVIAFLLGLDSLLALVVSLIAHILAPLTIALLTEWLIGPEISIGVWEMAQRLAMLIGAGFAIGMILRVTRVSTFFQSSPRKIASLEGVSVITLALVALALMDGVTAMALIDPTFVGLAFFVGFLLNPMLQLLGASLFAKTGIKTSLTVGLLSGYRNTGVLIAVLPSDTDPKIITFLAIVQIPTFLMPMLSGSIIHWIQKTKPDAANAARRKEA